MEKVIVASRGRNPNNPSDRTVGGPREQRLEINKKGVANTLTSFQKDNLVLEIVDTARIRQATKKGYIKMEVGGVFDATYPNSKTRRGRVQEGGTICPTITSGSPQIYRIEVMK